MSETSVVLFMYRVRRHGPQILLAHPGGPVWKNRDDGVWLAPKCDVEPGDDLLAAAQLHFEDFLGIQAVGNFLELKPIKKSGKVVHAWAFCGDCDPTRIRSKMLSMEWPPGSGKQEEFPEADRAVFFDLEVAERKINPAQAELLKELVSLIREGKGRQ
jgi:predicted NUDIX family NTP pyrophosphohydrolase